MFYKSYDEIEEVINDLINEFEFQIHLNKFPDELSKGNKQKLMIIMCLIQQYDVLIADEPFSGLDPFQIHKFKSILLELSKNNKYILISTHVLDLAETICDRVIIIDEGCIIEDERLDMLLRKWNTDKLEDAYIKIKERKAMAKDD